jgi:hypothetical protein
LLEDFNVEGDPIKLAKLTLDINSSGRRTGVFHASSIGGTSGKSLCDKYVMGCGRQLFYSISEGEGISTWEPRNRRILDTGSAIHLQLQTYLLAVAERSEGTEKFQMEVDINPDTNPIADALDISGHTDGIYEIDDGDDKLRAGVEIKTINDNGYKALNSPHKEHLIQATIYQKCLDLPVMIFLYYNKNDSSIAEYLHSYDVRMWQAIERKLNWIRDLAISGQEPDQEVSRSCQFCKYRHLCKPPRTAPKVSAARARGFTRRA